MAVQSQKGGIWHHGIYSDGKVYHFTGNDKSQATISLDYFMDFVAGRFATFIFCYPQGRCLPLNDVVAKARQIFTTKTWPEYSLLWNNCEHFATYCKTGKGYSAQVWDEVQRSLATAEHGARVLGPLGASVGLLIATVSLGHKLGNLNPDGKAKMKQMLGQCVLVFVVDLLLP